MDIVIDALFGKYAEGGCELYDTDQMVNETGSGVSDFDQPARIDPIQIGAQTRVDGSVQTRFSIVNGDLKHDPGTVLATFGDWLMKNLNTSEPVRFIGWRLDSLVFPIILANAFVHHVKTFPSQLFQMPNEKWGKTHYSMERALTQGWRRPIGYQDSGAIDLDEASRLARVDGKSLITSGPDTGKEDASRLGVRIAKIYGLYCLYAEVVGYDQFLR